jgi:HEAT repeat protein
MRKLSTAGYLGQPVTVWMKMLQDADPLLRRTAAHALGMIGPDARQAREVLTAALADEEGYVRVWAATALARVDRRKERVAVATLIAALKDPQHFVRSLAAWELGRLGAGPRALRAALPQLQALLADPDPSVRREASEALKRLQTRRRVEEQTEG